MSKSTCGPQKEILANDALRVTRCTCGIFHVTLLASGVTIQLKADAFRTIAAGLQAAVDKVDASPEITSTGSTSIN
jgi:hypothetical protein